MSTPLKIIFAGTPDFAVAGLDALLAHQQQDNLDIIAIYTQPDRPAGRGRKLKPSPVKARALEHNIPVYQPASLKDSEAQAQLAALNADVMIVAAYGLLLPEAVLNTPKFGCLNIHGSLLPRWRGAAPIHRAILNGDTETGITIMQMDKGLDTGDMLLKAAVPIGPNTTTGELHDDLARLGGVALIDVLRQLQAGTLQPKKQDDTLTNYASKLEKSEAFIDWHQTAEQIHRQVRAFNPWPVAQTHLEDKIMRVWNAHIGDSSAANTSPGRVINADKNGIVVACGEGCLVIDELQMPGGKRNSAANYLNAHSLDGMVFQ